jgi:hypothetical protein
MNPKDEQNDKNDYYCYKDSSKDKKDTDVVKKDWNQKVYIVCKGSFV